MNLNHITPNGATTFWRCSPTDRQKLQDLFQGLGLEGFVPPVRADADALRSAMKDYVDAQAQRRRGKDKLVQSLKRPKKNGFQVLDVERGEEDNDYGKRFSAKVQEGSVVITRGN